MERNNNGDWRECVIAEHIDSKGGECLVTGRYAYCIDCAYRNAQLSDSVSSINIRVDYSADDGPSFTF